ncbi:spore germination protein [Salirhabdus euzebyi]|uniref:Spore germination protein n=1 Tax=Salirhabdus euzebyi TaxID=394506 RepID=A0A841Q4T2_9BACI|nr:endospore germination permease [Salirhabdus euzebyi]MBB6453360.1 spore germination protein [Salirhabdus euzebyi]
MKQLDYADEKISTREFILGITSIILGIGVLSLPRNLAQLTNSSDGWISILIGGTFCAAIAWVMAKTASKFPKQTFYEYTSSVLTKPVSILISFTYIAYFICIAAISTRVISGISKVYMLERTPIEVISLFFLLVVIYAVSGSRIALFRLNLMFIPIIIFIVVVIQVFNIKLFDMTNIRPMFITNWSNILSGGKESIFAFLGFEIVLFYTILMKKPKSAAKAAVVGVTIPMVVYIVIYLFAIGVFSNIVTQNIVYPTIEMAKEVEIPGQFFERFESIFFTIWIMTIFNTTAMALDVSVYGLTSIFPKLHKKKLVFALAPIIYLISMMPQDFTAITSFSQSTSYVGVGLFSIPFLIIIVSKIKGVKGK